MVKQLLLLGIIFMNSISIARLKEPDHTTRTQFKEILVKYPHNVTALYNSLTPAERIMAYYLYRSSIPAHKIYADQMSPYSQNLLDIFITIQKNQELLKKEISEAFIKDAETYLTYLITNHGAYFKREQPHKKRIPETLGLKSLTKENLIQALELSGFEHTNEYIDDVWAFLSDPDNKAVSTVSGDIEASGVNIYSSDFTQKAYTLLNDKGGVNQYYYLSENGTPLSGKYAIGDRYSDELEIAAFWLEKALKHAQEHSELFDSHFVKSLEYLIEYLKTGNEDLFKAHSREWLKTKSRVTFTFGFIETYDDPMETTGSMAGEVTITTVALDDLSAILPQIERDMPLPKEEKRQNTDSLPNASINVQLYGAGDYGPLKSTLAYCLPNYNDIRSQDGSRQVIYQEEPSVAEILNPLLTKELFHSKRQMDWLNKHDPKITLAKDIRNVLTILHETIGHASGSLASHTFKEGDTLTVGGKTYRVGETIPVTNANVAEFLAGYEGTLEELRAEIIAVWVAINHLEDLVKKGLLANWLDAVGSEELTRWIIHGMAEMGLKRMLSQADDATEIAGHHARGNTVIMHAIIDAGGAEIVQENVVVNGKEYDRIAIEITDLEKAKNAITKLMQQVQHIKSTGDGQAAKELIDTYGKKIRDINHFKILKTNHKAIVGDIKALTHIYPQFEPVFDENNCIIDAQAKWPTSLFNMYLNDMSLCYQKD